MAAESNYIYWDSCVFIDGLRKTEGRYAQILQLETEAKAGHIYIFTSTLAIAEVVKLRQYGDLTLEEARQINGYFRHKFVKVIPLDRVIARHAAEIVRDHALKPPDAIHVATAIRARCSVLYTYDGNADEGMLCKNGLIDGLPIKRPGEFGQSHMFVQPP